MPHTFLHGVGVGGEIALGDLVADSHTAFEDAEERLWRKELRAALERALEELPEAEGTTLRRRYWHGDTLADIGRDMGTSPEQVRQQQSKGLRTLRHPRISKPLRAFIEGQTPYYLHVGVSRFNTTGTSAVEEIAIKRERLGQTWG